MKTSKLFLVGFTGWLAFASFFGCSEESGLTPIYPPSTPTDLIVTVNTIATATVQWRDTAPNNEGFAIERKKSGGAWGKIMQCEGTCESAVDTTLSVNNTYAYRVYAFNQDVVSNYSNEVSVSTLLLAPTNLKVQTVNATSLEVQWDDNSQFEDGYNIERKVGSGAWELVHTTTGNTTSHTDTDLSPITPYDYRVVTKNQTAFSEYSETVTGITYFMNPQKLTGFVRTVETVAFSPDGATVASAGFDGSIIHWQVSDGSCSLPVSGHIGAIQSIVFSPDGQTMASGSVDRTVKIWSFPNGECLKTLAGHLATVQSVAYSPDGLTLASGSSDKTIKIWRVSDGVCLQTLSGHAGYVFSVAFSPDGSLLASGSGNRSNTDNSIKIWRLSDGVCIQTLTGHSDYVESVSFNADGKVIASASLDQSIILWSVADGSVLHTLTGHANGVLSIAFSPNGMVLGSGSLDKYIKLWNVSTGACLATLTWQTESINSIAFSPDGKALASAGPNGTTCLWR